MGVGRAWIKGSDVPSGQTMLQMSPCLVEENTELEEKGQGHGPEGLETRSRLSVVEGIKVSVRFFLSLHFILLQRMD